MEKLLEMIDKIAWKFTPRVYICKDVIYIKWNDNEYIIKRGWRFF